MLGWGPYITVYITTAATAPTAPAAAAVGVAGAATAPTAPAGAVLVVAELGIDALVQLVALIPQRPDLPPQLLVLPPQALDIRLTWKIEEKGEKAITKGVE